MEKRLEDLEKQFITDGDMEHQEISTLVERAIKFARIDKNGYVSLLNPKDFKILEKIMLVLVSRYLANKLQVKLGKENPISEEVTLEDLEKMLREKRNVIIARIKDLRDENLILNVKNGIYSVQPHALNSFLNKLEGKNNGTS